MVIIIFIIIIINIIIIITTILITSFELTYIKFNNAVTGTILMLTIRLINKTHYFMCNRYRPQTLSQSNICIYETNQIQTAEPFLRS